MFHLYVLVDPVKASKCAKVGKALSWYNSEFSAEMFITAYTESESKGRTEEFSETGTNFLQIKIIRMQTLMGKINKPGRSLVNFSVNKPKKIINQ